MVSAFLVYLLVSLSVFDSFVFGRDLAIFDQVIRSWASFRLPTSDVLAPGANALGEHFSPAMALLAPLYWVWADPRILLGAQAALVAASIWPVWDFSRRRFGDRPALVVAVAYALSWQLQSLVAFDVHEVALAVPLIAVAINALDLEQDRVLILACAALLLVREDMGLFLVAVAAVLLVRRRFALAAGLAAVGAAVFGLLTLVVVPALAWDRTFHFWTFTQLGPDPRAALGNVLRRPWIVLQTAVMPDEKAYTLLLVLFPTAFMALGSVYGLLALPFLAEQLLNSRELLWRPSFHYWGVLAPILTMAAVDTVSRISRRLPDPRLLRNLWLSWITIVVAIGMLLLPASYSALMFLVTGTTTSKAAAALDGAVSLIPSGACVEADDRVLPHLGRDRRAFRVGGSQGLAPWVLVDRSDSSELARVDGAAYASALMRDGWSVQAFDGSVVLLKRADADASSCSAG